MKHSAGIIVYKKSNRKVKFLMVTPGGPYWTHRELWSFPKGEIELGENPDTAAIREFKEETSYPITNNLLYWGLVKQNKTKDVHVYYTEATAVMSTFKFISNKIEIEFPKNSGKMKEIDEIGEYRWMTYEEILRVPHIVAYEKIYKKLSNEE